MKRILAFVLCLAISLSLVLTGCGDSSDSKKSKKRSDKNNSSVDSEFTDDQLENIVVKDEDFSFDGYMYDDGYATVYFLIVTNNSEAPVEFKANGVARDADGGMLGATDLYIDVIGPGETIMEYFYFDNVTNVTSVDYTFEYEKSSYYYPVVSNIDVKQTINEHNVTVEATNNGTVPAEFVEACVLFFDSNNNIINYNINYFTDRDSEIKPQKTLASQFNCYNDFDHTEFYFTGGRSTKYSDETEDKVVVSDSDFEITEHIYEDYYSTRHYMIIKNNSKKDVEIYGNAIARDANGKALGAGDTYINILGPGETSICYFYFDEVQDVASVDYELYYNTDTYYPPVLGNLSFEQTANKENVIVAVTNNGKEPAMYVEAYALFFDENNNIIETDSTYFTDDDSEIKPGKTIVRQLNAYTAFDHVEVYFIGRGE